MPNPPISPEDFRRLNSVPIDEPLHGAGPYATWIEIANSVARVKYAGTEDDLRTYLTAIQRFADAAIAGNLAVEILPGIELPVPIALAEEIIFAYHYRASGRRSYRLDRDLMDALMDTDLRWIEARCFDEIPGGFALVIPRTPGLKIFCEGVWYPITDFYLHPVTIPGERASFLKAHPEAPEDGRYFFWEAVSRMDLAREGVLYRCWGSFCVHEDMRLDDLLSGLGAWSEEQMGRVEGILRDPVVVEALIPSQSASYLAETSRRMQEDFLKDMARHHSEHMAACLAAVCFLAKFVLLMGTDVFKSSAKRLFPPGFRTKPNPTKKAKEIQARLLERWGERWFVPLPEACEPSGLPHPHGSPSRHPVRPHFRSQPYGEGKTLRKTIWILKFWRGEFKFDSPAKESTQ